MRKEQDGSLQKGEKYSQGKGGYNIINDSEEIVIVEYRLESQEHE